MYSRDKFMLDQEDIQSYTHGRHQLTASFGSVEPLLYLFATVFSLDESGGLPWHVWSNPIQSNVNKWVQVFLFARIFYNITYKLKHLQFQLTWNGPYFSPFFSHFRFWHSITEATYISTLMLNFPHMQFITTWSGIVVTGVCRMNEVNAHRAQLVPGWVTVFGRVYHLSM